MNRHVSTRIVACATALAAAATAMGQVNIYQSSFEGTDGGWAATGDWQRGVPSSVTDCGEPGPAGAFDGAEVWATGLATCYSNSGARSVLSQSFDLSGAINPMLRFWQVVEVNGAFDFIEVYANGDLLHSYTSTARIDPYQEVVLDLAAYQGLAAVNISFELFASTVVNDPGWYIDDVRITSDVTPAPGDLQILSFEDTPDPVGDIGDPITYNVHVFNADPTNSITDVVVTTNLDASTTYDTSTTGVHAAGVHTANFASIAPLSGETFSITALTTALGDVTASTSATGVGAVADPDTANNMASAMTNVTLLADLTVAADDFPDPVIFAGEPISYTITVQNNGPADANNVAFSFALDGQSTFDSASAGLVHDGSPTGGVVTGALGTIADGGSTVLTVTVLAGDSAALYTANAAATADEADPTPADAAVAVETTIAIPPPNDDCFAATSIATFPFTDTQDTSLAIGDGPPAAISGCNSTSATTLHNSVWYHINVAMPQVITVTITDIDPYDLVAGVWEGTCGTIADLPLVCGDDPEPIFMQFVAAAGQDYMLGIGDWGSTAGAGGLTDVLIEASPVVAGACCLNDGRCVDGVDEIECTQMFGVFNGGMTCAEVSCGVNSANDYCENPATISEGVSTPGTTIAATGADLATCGLDELDVWYAFTPAANSGYVVDVTGNTTPISIAVYEGCGTTNISCDAGTVTAPPSAEFTADCVGTPVLIRVATNDTETSDFNIVVSPLFGTPLNDRCCAAEPIMLGELKFGDAGAAAAHDDGIDPCGFDERDVWYVFTPSAANTSYQAVIDPTTTMSVSIFDACPENGGIGAACDSSSLRGEAPFVSDASASPVLIRVAADASATLAAFDLQIFEDDDTCADATLIMSVPFSETVFDMENNFPDPDISCNSTATTVLNNGIWWTFEGTGNDVRLTMRDNGATSTFDEVFAVYEVLTGTDCATLTEFDEMIGGCSDSPEFIFDFHAQLGMTYYFLAGNWASSTLTDTGNEVFVSLESADNADVAVTLQMSTTVAAGIGLSGDPVKYFLDVTNNGPAPANNVPWTVTLPNEVVYGFSDDGVHDGSPTGGVVSGTIPFLEVGGVAEVLIVTDTTALGAGGSATADSPGGSPVDVDFSNNNFVSPTFTVVENSANYGQLILSDDFIDLNYGPEPKSVAPDLGGRLISGFDKPFISPNGTRYIINVDLEDEGTTPPFTSATDETLVVFDGTGHSTVVQEGVTLTPDLSDLVGLIDQKIAINDDGEYVFQTNTDGITGSDEVIIKGVGAAYTVIAREGNTFPDGGSLIYGADLESPNITNAGDVRFWLDTNPGSVSTTSTDEYVVVTADDGATVTHVLQEGVFVPGNQVNGGAEVLGDIDINDFWATGDGAHYLFVGDLDGGTTNDDVVVYDGNVVIQENVLVHPDLGDSADAVTAADAIFLAQNGDWYARGSNNNDTHWVVKNGVPIAVSGQPVYPGATEHWRATTTSSFFFVVADDKGNYVVGGFTESTDERADVVLVLNGERVISREFDPIDLDGNGSFDDSPFHTGGPVFIHTYGNDDGIITDDGRLLVTTQTRTIVTDNTGDVFISIDLGLEPACPCETDGADGVDVFDLLAYLDLWFVNDAGADLDGAAGVDVFDLLFFLDCWFPASAGAPC